MADRFWRAFAAVCMVPYYLLVMTMAALTAGLVVYLARQFDASRCLEAVHARLLDERRDPAEVFSLRSGSETRHIPLADILIFETAPKPHHVFLHTADSRVDFVGSLGELERELGGRFIRVHRAYLAAADKIEAVDRKGNRVRIGGRECLLSRAGKMELRKKLGGDL